MPTPKTHRPSVSDIALAAVSRRPADPVSKVELARNAKGDVQIGVDVSHADPFQAAKIAADLFDVLRDKYPRTEPTDAEQEVKRLGNAARIHAARAKKASGA